MTSIAIILSTNHQLFLTSLSHHYLPIAHLRQQSIRKRDRSNYSKRYNFHDKPGIINAALLSCKILQKLTVNIPSRLYHYTTESSLLGIIESGVLYPSLDQNGRTTMFGSGQYFTNIAPEMIACIGTRACRLRADLTLAHREAGQISLIQLSGRIMDGAMAIERLECFIEFSVSGLNISATESPHIYLNRSNLVLRYGKAPR